MLASLWRWEMKIALYSAQGKTFRILLPLLTLTGIEAYNQQSALEHSRSRPPPWSSECRKQAIRTSRSCLSKKTRVCYFGVTMVTIMKTFVAQYAGHPLKVGKCATPLAHKPMVEHGGPIVGFRIVSHATGPTEEEIRHYGGHKENN